MRHARHRSLASAAAPLSLLLAVIIAVRGDHTVSEHLPVAGSSDFSSSSPAALHTRRATGDVSAAAVAAAKPASYFNKVVWLYWDHGSPSAMGHFAIRTWKELNPDWQVRMVGDADLDVLIEESELKSIRKVKTLANRCDLIRLYLLMRYGGVYADMDTLSVIPLDDWLFSFMPEGQALYPRLPADKYNRSIASWFLGAYNGSSMITKHYQALIKHVRGRPSHNFAKYLQMHFLFSDLLHSDADFKQGFDDMPVLWGAYAAPLVDAAINATGKYSMGVVCCLSGRSPDSMFLPSMRRDWSQEFHMNAEVAAMVKSGEVPVIKSSRHSGYPKKMVTFMPLCGNILKNKTECSAYLK